MSKVSNAIAMMETAKIWKEQSKCSRLKVGAVLACNGKIISHGYNGTPAHFKYNCNDLFDYDLRLISSKLKRLLKDFKGFDETMTMNGTTYYKATQDEFLKWHHRFSDVFEIHAEPNAIISAFTDGTRSLAKDMVLFVTTIPCEQCCKLIAQTGIKTVVYDKTYDRSDPQVVKETLNVFGTQIYQIDEYLNLLETEVTVERS